mgnify:CR=1 FL=1
MSDKQPNQTTENFEQQAQEAAQQEAAKEAAEQAADLQGTPSSTGYLGRRRPGLEAV